MLLKIAFRNVLRNGRRSIMTASAIVVGAVALILLGEFRGTAVIGLETGYVQSSGHLSVFREGYFEFGSGRPEAYSISNYQAVMDLIASDPVLKPMLYVVTPTVSLGGIAGNTALDRSRTFFGTGFIPSDQDKMRRWDEYRLYTTVRFAPFPFSDKDVDHGVVGMGLARILGVCTPLKFSGCPPETSGGGLARLDLLSGSSGAPNVVTIHVAKAQRQGARELDDSYVGMHLALAQQLLYGNGERKVSALVLQLKRSEDMAPARARLNKLFVAHGLNLEVRDYRELSPTYNQVISALGALFAFLSLILGIIILFTIANTMGMNVMERISEIGTARAMGMRRSAVGRQFLLEGAILGAIGATCGAAFAIVLTGAVNHAGITYHMPISASPIPLYLMDEGVEGLFACVWLALVVLAIVASLIPATRAARLRVVDALRHV